jgi:hypothetical protein
MFAKRKWSASTLQHRIVTLNCNFVTKVFHDGHLKCFESRPTRQKHLILHFLPYHNELCIPTAILCSFIDIVLDFSALEEVKYALEGQNQISSQFLKTRTCSEDCQEIRTL